MAIFKHSIRLLTGSVSTTKKLSDNIIKRVIQAVESFNLPAARGLFCVRKTCLSIFLSHKSLATHPAPLTNRPPASIFKIKEIDGGEEGASHRDQPAGMSKINLPLGLFHLSKSIKLLICFLIECFSTEIAFVKD